MNFYVRISMRKVRKEIGMKNRAGYTVHNLEKEMAYDSFYPQTLPPDPPIEIDEQMRTLLIDAHSKLTLLNGLTNRIPDRDLFISMYVRKEALVSSQIEGTQCTLQDILDPRIEENVNADVSDVINSIRATDYAIDQLDKLPLCNRLIRKTHAVLMDNVRGSDKEPGSFRTSQNWIGGIGSTLKNARYIPPNPTDMTECMSSLEKFMNEDDGMDPLIKAALLHYQFVTIHPFLDGNGRIGRLLVTLFLIGSDVISSPVLYLSCFLKLNRIEYYDRMSEVRRTGNYEQWVRFFLKGIAETAQDATETIDRLMELHRRNEEKLNDVPSRFSRKIRELFFYVEHNPIIETKRTAVMLGVSRNAAAKYIDVLCEKGILKNTAKSGKTLIFSYEEYLDLLRKDT